MILSVHLIQGGIRAGLGLRRSERRLLGRRGLIWGRTTMTVPLAAGFPPLPSGGAIVAAWEEEAALDDFLAQTPLGRRADAGWQVRLEPLRAYGSWSELPDLGRPERPVQPDEPVAVLTLGRLRLRRAVPFFRATAPAERQAAGDDALLFMTGLARLPRTVATFSVWRSAEEMRAYADGRAGGDHVAAMRAHHRRPFHHEAVFARFRPYAARGSWYGHAPLVGAAPAASSGPVAQASP